MTAADALGHVVGQVTAAGADAIAAGGVPGPGAARDPRRARPARRTSRRPRARRDIRASVAERMSGRPGAAAVETPLAVDLRLDCALVLPEAVAREAEAAAAALTRLTPYPSGSPAFRDYHARFLDRYGMGALVPVAECVNADTGLGFPAGYRNSILETPAQPPSDRDERLLALAQIAAMDGGGEVVLDDRAIAELAGGDAATVTVPPSVELHFHVHAPTPGALDRGEFALVVAGASRAGRKDRGPVPGSARRGRPRPHDPRLRRPAHGGRRRVVGAAVRPAALRADGERRPHHRNPPPPALRGRASRRRRRRPAAAGRPGGGRGRTSALSGVAVPGADGRTRAAERGGTAVIAPSRSCVSSTRSPVRGPPPSPRSPGGPPARCRSCRGSGTAVPCWRPPAGTSPPPACPAADAPWPAVGRGAAARRRRLRVPDAVYLGEGDRRIRLDLAEPAHLSPAALAPGPHRPRHPVARRPAQTRTGGSAGAPTRSSSPWPPPAGPVAARPAPGLPAPHRRPRSTAVCPGCSEWLFVKLYGHPDRHAGILTTHLPGLMSAWDGPPEWWYVRYRDPDPHLRLRLRLADADGCGRAVRRVGAWAADLRRLGLAGRMQAGHLRPGDRPLRRRGSHGRRRDGVRGRLGGGRGPIAAHRFRRRQPAPASVLHPHALTAASFADLAVAFTGGTGAGMRWLTGRVPKTPVPAPARDVHDEAVRLADPHGGWAALRGTPGGDEIAKAWSRRRTALAAYRARLLDAGDVDPDPDTVLAALLHMHHIRMNGVDEEAERSCRRLARVAALAWAARHGRGGR